MPNAATATLLESHSATASPDVPPRRLRVGIVTLGCDKNTVDNEYLAGMLEAAGCEIVTRRTGNPEEDFLDAAVVTTCGFIGPAKQQSIDAIIELATRKRTEGSPRRLLVAGCLAQRYADELLAEIPEIDALVGVGQFRKLTELIAGPADETAATAAPRDRRAASDADAPKQGVRGEDYATELNGSAPAASLAPAQTDARRAINDVPVVDIYQHIKRRALDNRPHAFLKVSDGCNHTCTFCSIPIMKGRLRSVPPEIVLEEARALIARGVKELNIVAQDLSMYGMDRWKEWRTPRLLREICALPGDFWVRCLYYYPGLVTDDFIEVMATESKIVPYLDMPLQHLDPGVLRRMKRPFHEVNTFKVVERLRAAVPNLTLRSTMIVGFPGETLQEHRAMLRGLETLRFDRLGAFEYSLEEDTPAGQMEAQVARRTAHRRWEAVMATQSKIAAELNAARIGTTTRVLIEGKDDALNLWQGRSPGEAPEIDGKVFIESVRPLPIGEFVDVKITRADTYDVYASV